MQNNNRTYDAFHPIHGLCTVQASLLQDEGIRIFVTPKTSVYFTPYMGVYLRPPAFSLFS